MSSNTRERSNQLNALAAEIAAREKIDPTVYPIDSRPYIAEIMTRGECHRETARAIWARWLRRNRSPDAVATNGWGGAGRGQGRKPAQPEEDDK